MNVIRGLLGLTLVLVVLLLLAIIISAIRRAYTERIVKGPEQTVEKCVDLLVVEATFTLDPAPPTIQGVGLEEGMSVIVQTNSTDDGVYMVMRRQLVRIMPLVSGEVFKVLYGLYRNTIYTIPQPSSLGFLVQRGGSLRHNAESFVVVAADDTGAPFPLVATDKWHVVSIGNETEHEIPFTLLEQSFTVSPGDRVRVLVSGDGWTELSHTTTRDAKE